MSEQKAAKVPMRRGLRVLLIASLAMNVAVVGLAIGAAFNWQRSGPPRAVEFSAGQLGRGLERADRRAIGAAVRQDPNLRPPSRAEMRQINSDLVAAITAEPFDRTGIEAILQDFQGRVLAVRGATSSMILDQLEDMSAEQRAAFAENFERTRRNR